MKILVYGAGGIGCLYAARLAQAGEAVTLLARGERLAQLREQGIRLEDVQNGTTLQQRVELVEQLRPNDFYDVVLVALPRDHVSEVLPVLARNTLVPCFLFFGNNAGGPWDMIERVGRARVLLGFPGAGAVRENGTIRYVITSAREQPTTLGEIDGRESNRIRVIANALERAGFPVEISANMDAWLKTHVAEISPTANALYMAGGDPDRLAENEEALRLLTRAIREGYEVLHHLGVPITPAKHRMFEWLPEPLLVWIIKRSLRDETTGTKLGHALAARHEMRRIAEDMRTLAQATPIGTPAMDRLYRLGVAQAA